MEQNNFNFIAVIHYKKETNYKRCSIRQCQQIKIKKKNNYMC